MFQTEKNKTIFILIVILIIVGGYFLWREFRGQIAQTNDQTNNSPVATSTFQYYEPECSGTTAEERSKYVGVISQNTNGQNVYTTTKYHLSFSYPQGWNINEDSFSGCGGFQIFNFKPEMGQKGFLEGQNKIEANFSIMDSIDLDKITDFPQGATTTKVNIMGKTVIRYESHDLIYGLPFIFYTIPLPNTPGKYLTITIYGDPSNFYVLDNLVKSLEWLK